MDRELDHLSMHDMVAWLGKNCSVVELKVIKKSIYHRFGVHLEDISIIKHFLVDFFIDLKHCHQHDEAVAKGGFPYGDLNIHTRYW